MAGFLLLSPLLAACSSDDGVDDAPAADAESAANAPEPSPAPEETNSNWERRFLSDLSLSFDEDEPPSDKKVLAAGRAACEELEYDYGDGSFSGGRAAVARVQDMLGEDEPTSWTVVESASDFICEWSHLVDEPLPFPPRSSFKD
ncbi:hypothetical protein ACFWN5_11950 [Streptomyces sp. NPDC058430]|uniref:hypothetical protein n=1 Tax=Streptomyces sp. NPDC058430 TaxID=3346495 RepID=UPI003650EE7B